VRARRTEAMRSVPAARQSPQVSNPKTDRDPDGLDPRTELTALLRIWRKRRRPDEYPSHPELRLRSRRLPYLTGEDVATLVGVTPTWYRAFEAGELNGYRLSFLHRVATMLKLDVDERAALFLLAIGHDVMPMSSAQLDQPTAGLRTLLDAQRLPAYLLDRAGNIIARNHTSLEWFPSQETETSIINWMFHNRAAREQYLDWQSVAENTMAGLRNQHARVPRCPRLKATLRILLSASREAKAIWDKPRITSGEDGRIRRIQLPHAPSWTDVEVVISTLDRSRGARLYLLVPVGGHIPSDPSASAPGSP